MSYEDISLADLVDKVKSMSYDSIQRMRTYHKNKGHDNVVEKIDKAKQLMRYFKLEQKLDDMSKELDSVLAEYSESTSKNSR